MGTLLTLDQLDDSDTDNGALWICQEVNVWMYQSVHTTVRDSYFYGTQGAASESYATDTFTLATS